MSGCLLLGRRAIAQVILSSLTSATSIPAIALRRKAFTGKASAGGASSITLAANAPFGTALEGFLEGCTVEILAGTGAGQTRTISGYVGSTRVATVSVAWVTQPDNTSVYRIRHAMDDVTARAALVRCETAAVLACIDGSTPTVAVDTNIGMGLSSGEAWLLDDANNAQNFKVINAVNASGSVVKVITFA